MCDFGPCCRRSDRAVILTMSSKSPTRLNEDPLFGACGAASRDEFNEPGQGLAAVFGIEPAIRSEVRPDEYRVRGSLNWTDYFDRIRLDRTPPLGEPAAFGVLGVRITFTPTTGQVVGRFFVGRF